MNIKILSKDDTLNIISDETFIARWGYLAKNTSCCTIMQEYGFVISWYLSYLETYKPMMVVGYDDKESIVGILPLAIASDTGRLSHAGENQAEYHGWICSKEYEEEFLVQSLISIKKDCNVGLWEWGWLPSEINLEWMNSALLHQNGIYLNKITADSPLHNLKQPDKLQRILRRKSSKINRLKRTGELRIERIYDRDYAEKLFDTIENQYNFRHLSLYDNIPFQADKNKRAWHLNQLELMPENTHFTVLWHGDELLACNFGCHTSESVILGLHSYNPVRSESSPGTIFLIELLELMKEEGFQYLDLTPGGDSYKERFANKHVNVIKLSVSFNRYQWIKDSARILLWTFLKKYVSARDLASIKNLSKKGVLELLKSSVHEQKSANSSCFVYKGKAEAIINEGNTLPLREQQYIDLLLYSDDDGILSRKEFVHQAMKKFDRGDRLYTMVSGNELIVFIWLTSSGKKHWHLQLKEKIEHVKNSLFIYDFYTSDNAGKNKIFQSCIQQILKDIQLEKRSETYLVKPVDIDEKIVNEIGFVNHPIGP